MTNATQVEELVSRQQIHEVLMRYCRGVDRADEAMIRSCYHADGFDDHGVSKQTGWEFATSIVATIPSVYATTLHMIGNELIEIEGEKALAESYFVAYHVPRTDPSIVHTFAGRYVDRFERRDGRWAIAHRVVVHEWSGTLERGAPFMPAELFAQPAPAPDDTVYRMRSSG